MATLHCYGSSFIFTGCTYFQIVQINEQYDIYNTFLEFIWYNKIKKIFTLCVLFIFPHINLTSQ